jgi:nucleotide-binding universal stress UspA family protein
MTNPFERILAATDGSVASLKAARLAIALAGSCAARVRIVAVVDDETVPRAQSRKRREDQLRDTLQYLRRLGTDAGVEVEVTLEKGAEAAPFEVILEEADRWRADLLFLGRRSHRGLGRALLGSQAEHVLEFSRLPVVVVPESATSEA